MNYETRMVRAIRGAESRTASKWEKEGWEVVSQSQGKLQSEITIRRPKPKAPTRLYAIGGAVAAIALITIIVNGVISEQGATDRADGPTPVTSQGADEGEERVEPMPSEESKPEPERSSLEEPDAVITPESNTEFATLLSHGDNCDDSIAAFIEEHRGRTVAFDGNVSYMAHHGEYDTRYDILISAGEYSETSTSGPTFQFEDVNTTSDLHWTGENPGTVGPGDNLRFTAQVVGEIYPEKGNWNCLFYLDPVATETR
ncbi:DUF4839 domain-containing protein [Microbacteriaceae bacterium 4G12]